MALLRSILLARLIVGGVLLGFLSGAVGTVAEAAPEHPRQAWQRALADGTVERAVQHAQALQVGAPVAFDAQVEAFLDMLAATPGGDRLVAYLGAVADPADVLRALLGTSHLGAAVPLGFADTWLAPAPPSSSTLGTRAALVGAPLPTFDRTSEPVHFSQATEGSVVPAPRERYPAIQPLGP